MNFTKTDMAITVSMMLAIVSMSFVFPALGLTAEGNEAQESNIPEFDIDSDRFDFSGEFPDNPGTPSTGTMTWVNSSVAESDNNRWITQRDTSDGAEISTLILNNEPTFTLTVWDGGTDTTYNVGTTTEGHIETIDTGSGGWIITVEFTSIETIDATNGWYNFTVEYEIEERPESDGGWISSIPIVGTLFGAGSAVASGIVWIGSVIWWGITWLFTISANLLSVLLDVTIFLFSTLVWLITTYSGIVGAAGSWAAVFVAIPGILLMLELGKMAMLGIKMLPTT